MSETRLDMSVDDMCAVIDKGMAEIDMLRTKATYLQAQLTARCKSLVRARDILMFIRDDLDDEGDRVYFGSTNHAETFKDLAEEFDGWVWDDIIHGASLRDYIGELRTLHDAYDIVKAGETEAREQRDALYEALTAIVEAEEAAMREWDDSGAPPWGDAHPAYQRYQAARTALQRCSPQDAAAMDETREGSE